jgi:hypothetical protein
MKEELYGGVLHTMEIEEQKTAIAKNKLLRLERGQTARDR